MQVIITCVYAWVSFYVPVYGPPSCNALGCTTVCTTPQCLTASGVPAGPGIAACGPAWRLGDRLTVEAYHQHQPPYTVVCGDRFGAPPDPWAVDLYAPSLASAGQQGGHWFGPVCHKEVCKSCAQ